MSKKKPKEKKPWSITQEDIASITNEEFIRGTDRLLPPLDEIPKAFLKGNVYTRIVEAMYVGDKPEHAQIDFLPGFVNDGTSLARVTMAHMRYMMGTDYHHKIAGIGYMISKIIHVTIIINK
jgi:hypothetical protein